MKHKDNHPQTGEPTAAATVAPAPVVPAAGPAASSDPTAPAPEKAHGHPTGKEGHHAHGGHEREKKLQTEIDDLKDRLLRTLADFDNYRKRVTRERKDTEVMAGERMVRELIPVMDHFELALQTARQAGLAGSVIDGFQMVASQLLSALEKSGLRVYDAGAEEFDPHRHEAISHIPSDTIPANHVISQTRRGYMLGDRMVRAAQVVVSSGKPADPGAKQPDAGSSAPTVEGR